MNRLILSALVLGAALFALPASQANASGYCLVGEMNQCTFTSFAQCLEAANGVAGWCVPDGDIDAPATHRTRH